MQRLTPLLALAVALLTFLVFAPGLQNQFLNWDDQANFLDNPNYRGFGGEQIRWMWTNHLQSHYIPLTWMTLGLDYVLWEMDPLGYHLSNILWHTAAAVLFYFVALALLRLVWGAPAQSQFGAAFAALIFSIHPLRAESVAWVTERRDAVSAVFYFLAILAYLRAFRGAPVSRKHYWLSLLWFVCAILSKEMAVTLPVVLLILDVYPLRRLGGKRGWVGGPARAVWLEKLPFFLIGLADGLVTIWAGHQERVTAPFAIIGWTARLGACVYSLAFYLWKTVVPIHLAPFYAMTPHRVDPRALPFQLSAVLLLLLLAACGMFRRRVPALPAAFAVYAVTLFPVMGLFQGGQHIAADRFSYLACLGWALLAGGFLAALLDRGRLRVPAACGAITILAVLGFLTWRQVQVWKDSETLWTHAVQVEPSFMAFDNLGAVRLEQHDTAGAIQNFRQALALNPGAAKAHNNLGGALLDLNEWGAAIPEFQSALQYDPYLATAQNGWGYALLMQGRRAESIEHFQRALLIDPRYENARQNLARALAEHQ